MKCVILAAGYATRLYPLTENFPKPLLDVGGKPILDCLIDDIASEIDEFLVVTNHKFADHFEKWGKERKEKITIVDDGTMTNETRFGAVKDLQLAVNRSNSVENTSIGCPSDLPSTDVDYLVMAGDNMLDFSLKEFIHYQKKAGTSCVMCHEENELKKLQKTAVITLNEDQLITSYEEKPQEPKGNLAVPPFYIYTSKDISRIQEALEDGCSYDAPGSFAAWTSKHTPMHAWKMTGHRYDIGDVQSYEAVRKLEWRR